MKYVERIRCFDAILFTGKNFKEIHQFLKREVIYDTEKETITFSTYGAKITLCKDRYIAKNPDGEFWTMAKEKFEERYMLKPEDVNLDGKILLCTTDIFEKTYEPV